MRPCVFPHHRHSPPAVPVTLLSLDVDATATVDKRAALDRRAQPPHESHLTDELRKAFDVPFAVLHLASGELNHVSARWLPVDTNRWLPLLEEVARRGKTEFIEDCAPLVVLAAPLPAGEDEVCDQVALASLLTQPVSSVDDIRAAAAAIRVDVDVLWQWCQQQPVWPARAIAHLSQAIVELHHTTAQNRKLRAQLTNVSQHLLQTFDELNLLHRIHERLSLEIGGQQLLDTAVEWLSRVLPAECLLACIEPSPENNDASREWVVAGKCPVPPEEIDLFLTRLGPDVDRAAVLVDAETTASATWFYPEVREAISVPIRSGNRASGWLVAINRCPPAAHAATDFGTLETSLLSSVASMIGMHAGNVQLFNDQANFFESVVRALSSAIDAKDPYTRGHSERVARIAVLIAQQLGCTTDEINSIYLSGLLHDIGKIGIDDTILRKPGDLTTDEFEHIKLHPTLGHGILKGVKQLDHVLPVVLHHHEAWDGSGYPGKLAGKAIPWLARIVAVADAFDAMSSDRPYRKGLPADELDAIFRAASGKQWDPEVVTALFAVRDAIDAIISEDREQLRLDVGSWGKR